MNNETERINRDLNAKLKENDDMRKKISKLES